MQKIRLEDVHFFVKIICAIYIQLDREYAECSHLEDTGRMRHILNILCRRASVIRIIYRRLN